MIKSVANIGEYLIKKEDKSPLSIIIQEPNVKHVIGIFLNKFDKDYEYETIRLEEFDSKNYEKYLYRRGESQGANVTPSCIITDIDKTFKKKFLHWFSYSNLKNLSNEEIEEIQKIKITIEKNQEIILNDIKKTIKTISNNEINNGILLTLVFKENNNLHYLLDLKIFRNILINRSNFRYYNKYGIQSIGNNKICSLCLKEVDAVYGFTSDIFPFYTLDKCNFAPSFTQKNGWKLYPVCAECSLNLEEGKKYIEKVLNLNFYGGFRYYLIPKFIDLIGEDYYNTIFDLFELYSKDPSFSKEKKGWIGDLTSTEDRILELLSREKNSLTLNLIFYDKPNPKELKILLSIEDVLPSYLRKLFEIKKDLDENELFYNNNISFNFEILYNIFVKSIEKDKSKKYYIDTVGKIFTGRKIDYTLILFFLIKRIRKNFTNNINTKDMTLKGFMLLLYLDKLLILNKPKMEDNMESQINQDIFEKKSEIANIADKVFSQYGNFFDSDIKKAIFLEGVLTQKLLNIQYRDRKSTPFRNKLNGLKLDEKRVRALLPQIQAKLEDYGKNYYKDIEKLISEYFLKSGDRWKMGNNEISFYFVLGMNLVDAFVINKDMEVDEE
ncbi:MAG: CRISPR-associated protein [Candidatus Methanofastidiosum methylothiophilum]|uniref:CRISPR-associated protein n=1 Tax=Candidatus Methanofastidiosum methylothiophilum TaxID=1705564 RepID=A0A150IPB1_9EURY|nr:MAG: CRISPR-associated protein [Candidatus Methanofastidiosum methylthiophilus]KYC46655.1 MAG: CRISPR-associated protein [Candidatus Methanofastidiosum methylthiophilus]KYC49079.1 MAG: CRISPR-associated protein [Candidatus Methanofastidiosum methylthiophilus]